MFDNIPGPFKLAFYTVLPMMFVYGAVLFSYRVRNWERGGPDNRDITPKNAKKRLLETCVPACTCRRCCATPPPGSCTR